MPRLLPKINIIPVYLINTPFKRRDSKGSIIIEQNISNSENYDHSRFYSQEMYPIREPYSYVNILTDKLTNENIYWITEPLLTIRDSNLLDMLKTGLESVTHIIENIEEVKDKEEFIKETVRDFIRTRELWIDSVTLRKVEYYLIRDFLGYSVIDPLMKDPNIEDISCDGVNIPVYVYHRKYENLKTNIVFETPEKLNSFIVYLAQKGNKQISVSEPILDASTPEGNRINATFGDEVTAKGGTFTIRLFRETPFTPIDLVIRRTASSELVAYMWMMVEHGRNAMVLGGTGAGKTSTLNALSLFIPPNAKIVSIEDTREINLPHLNWIASTTRSGTTEKGLSTGKGIGEIDMFDLVRAALRQRPNYIIVGEVRGQEAYNLFQAMATGHITYGTMHAESIKSMVSRLTNKPINIPKIMLTSLNNVSVQMQVRYRNQLVRRIKFMHEITGYDIDSDEIETNTVFEWNVKNDKIEMKGSPDLFRYIGDIKNMTEEKVEEEFRRRVLLIDYLTREGITDYLEIWKYINEYYRNPIDYSNLIREKMKEKWGEDFEQFNI